MSPRRRIIPGNRRVAVALLRVSTDEQHLGPEAQRAAIAAWAARGGVEIASWHQEAVSGAARLEERLGLQAALLALEAAGAGLLVVSKRDRLARDPIAAAMIERLCERAGAKVVSADGVGEGDDPSAQLMRRMVDAFAEYERAIIRGRTKAALAAKQARGELTGQPPLGYRLAADGVRLEPDPAEQVMVVRVRELRAEGLSFRAIAAQLNAEGMRSRAGGPLMATQVARIETRAIASELAIRRTT